MLPFRLLSGRVATLPSLSHARPFASRTSIAIPSASKTPPAFPVIPTCPSPTCACRPSPSGLEIDRDLPLSGTMPAHAKQVLISTGREDWSSKIEDEEDSVLLKQMKKLLGRGGKMSDPYHNVMITYSSFAPSPAPVPNEDAGVPGGPGPFASAFLFPSFKYIPNIATSPSAVERLLRGFILPTKLHSAHDVLTPEQQKKLIGQPGLQHDFPARPVTEIMVLICGHGGRDERCGKLGPVLRDEFQDQLAKQNVNILGSVLTRQRELSSFPPTARVGLISHIGGHKFAGNVIIYIPPTFHSHPLAGRGIWYGRVAPEHVEGIVSETILGGKVVEELFRGGIDSDGEMLRL